MKSYSLVKKNHENVKFCCKYKVTIYGINYTAKQKTSEL